MELRFILEALRDGRLSAAEAKSRLVAIKSENSRTPASLARSGDIAIISMAGRFPGAPDVETFWSNLREGVDNIIEVPSSRWNADEYFCAEKAMPGKSYCRWGGFIDDINCFDPIFFKISPREAELMDPQERLLLQVVWSLFERIGYTRPYLSETFDGEVGVFTGAMYQQYHSFETDLDKKAAIAVSSLASMANRISHFFDFTGPSLTLDTMCSSASTALHFACESLRSGSCKLAVVGAANLSMHPFKYIALSQAQLLASEPTPRVLGQTDGFLPGEAVGAVLLKPLSQAIEDQENVVAIIRSTAINHKGYAAGFSVPNAKALKTLMERNFAAADFSPSSVDYIETSASGAVLGDAAEFEAIRAVYGRRDDAMPLCRVGSVKGNIGHTEAASGIAQVIKVACQLRDRTLVPTVRLEPINPGLRADEPPFRPQRCLEPWVHPFDPRSQNPRAAPRRAAVHTFAAGGSNAHILLEEFVPPYEPEPAATMVETGPWLLVLSAATPERLLAVVKNLRDHLAVSQTGARNVIFTLWHGREAMACRIAWVLDDETGLDHTLAAAEAFLQGAQRKPCPAPMHYGYLDEIVPAPEAAPAQDREALEDLAEKWVKGFAMLPRFVAPRSGTRARRMLQLPTYPFAKLICWVPQAQTGPASTPATKEVEADGTPPVKAIGNQVEMLVRSQIAFLTRLDAHELLLGTPLLDYGLNSMTTMALATTLCQAIGSSDESRDGGLLAQCRTAGELIHTIEALTAAAARGVQDMKHENTEAASASGLLSTADGFVIPDTLQFYNSNGYYFNLKNQAPSLFSTKPSQRRAVVIGAGPGGLVAALTLVANSYQEVIVVEKRQSITRMQMVTLYRHTLHYLKRMGVLDRILRAASCIVKHEFYLTVGDARQRYYWREPPADFIDTINPTFRYDEENIGDWFEDESVLAISLADLQNALMRETLERGVHYISEHEATLVPGGTTHGDWRVRLEKIPTGEQYELEAELIVLADGVRGKCAQAAGIDYSFPDPSHAIENWYVYHCASRPIVSSLIYEFGFDRGGELDHCAFALAYPLRNEFGVALCSCRQSVPDHEFLTEKAEFFARTWNLPYRGINWLTKPISVRYTLAQQIARDNLVLVGDVAGTGSPCAGLGSGLAISAYGWALNEYCARAAFDRDEAAAFYRAVAGRYPRAWQSRSAQIWGEVRKLPTSVYILPFRERGAQW
jgi:3-oxoacyl-(acyl-carrier-protein) synthase/2-polyprenyl-6-methoxyphenol hydroxylase-like FAD-dependent oxidoreductase